MCLMQNQGSIKSKTNETGMHELLCHHFNFSNMQNKRILVFDLLKDEKAPVFLAQIRFIKGTHF